MVSLVTSTMVLHGIAGIKGVAGLGSWAALSVVGRLRNSFSYPLTVRTDTGSSFTLEVVCGPVATVHALPHCVPTPCCAATVRGIVHWLLGPCLCPGILAFGCIGAWNTWDMQEELDTGAQCVSWQQPTPGHLGYHLLP